MSLGGSQRSNPPICPRSRSASAKLTLAAFSAVSCDGQIGPIRSTNHLRLQAITGRRPLLLGWRSLLAVILLPPNELGVVPIYEMGCLSFHKSQLTSAEQYKYLLLIGPLLGWRPSLLIHFGTFTTKQASLKGRPNSLSPLAVHKSQRCRRCLFR